MIKSLVLALFLFLICFFSGAVNWVFQFILVSFAYFITGVLLANRLRYDNSKKWVYIFLSLPFIIIYGVISVFRIYNTGFYVTSPIWIGAIFYGFLGYIVYQKGLQLRRIIITCVLTVFLNFIFIHNWFAFAFEKEFEVMDFPEISLVTQNNKEYDIKDDTNKILIFDLWSTSCGVCIEKFPDYEKLSEEYAGNSEVKFYSLNLPNRRDSLVNAADLVANYKFETLFAPDKSAWKALQIQTVPHFIIVNKDSKIVYKGRMHDKWYHLYNNIHNLIDNNIQ